MGGGRVLGAIFIVAGIGICALVSLFIGTGLVSGQVGAPGAALGIGVLGGLPLIVLAGIGLFVFTRGQSEEKELAEVRKKERLLGLIQAQGQVPLGTAMIEMKLTRDQITSMIYELVQQGLFAGYIDWQSQTFFSKDAAQVGSTKCPNCGGVREVAGKGVVKCPYCGVQLFIPAGAS